MADNDEQLKELADLLSAVLQDIYADTSVPFDGKPKAEKENLTEYEGKFRITAMDKFEEKTFIAASSFYFSESNRKAHNAIGALIVYLPTSASEQILKGAGFKKVEEEDLESVTEGLEAFTKKLMDLFLKKLGAKGYSRLIYSDPDIFTDDVPLGIDFSEDQFDKYAVSYSVKGDKALSVDLTMGLLS